MRVQFLSMSLSLLALAAVSHAQAAPSWPALSPAGAAAQQAALTWLNTIKDGKSRLVVARYMAAGCDPADANWGGAHSGFEAYQGHAITRCEYPRTHPAASKLGRPEVTLLAVIWMLNADAPTVARWVGSACQMLGSTKPAACGQIVTKMIIDQNGAQFAVAGHVLETQSEAGCGPQDCKKNLLIYLPFRDGITVKMAADGPSRRHESFADFAAAHEGAMLTLGTVADVRNVGRIANVTRGANLDDAQWLASNRDAYLAAFQSGSYAPLVNSARAFCRETNPQGKRLRDCGL